jgi:hypothetical protein
MMQQSSNEREEIAGARTTQTVNILFRPASAEHRCPHSIYAHATPQSPGAHSALSIPEICIHITKLVSPPDPFTGEQETKQLLDLACVSKAFQDPALDELWRELRSVTPLVRLLPDDAWHIDENGFPVCSICHTILST